MNGVDTDPLLAFFSGTGTDDAGRYHAEILAWPDYRLEVEHDYIQWLFPSRQRSRFNPNAPRLQPSTIKAFRAEESLRAALVRGFERMASFYGFAIRHFADGSLQLDAVADFETRSRAWLTRGNHNYARLTRILTSLRLLGCPEQADALFDVLDWVYRRHPSLIGQTTYGFWRSAAAVEG